MTQPTHAKGRTAANAVQDVLGCGPERAGRVVSLLRGVMNDPDTRAFLCRFTEIAGVGAGAPRLTPETAFLHIGRREVGLFLVRCTDRADAPEFYGEEPRA